MGIFDRYILKKDKLIRRRIEIDVTLYEELEKLSEKIYDASVNKLVNIAIIGMIENKNIKLYKRSEQEITEPHNFLIRETSYNKLVKYKEMYGLSIYKLVNIAIYNALNSEE